MMSEHRTIEIELHDGDPKSIKTVHIKFEIYQAIFIPRSKFDKIKKISEVNNKLVKSGVYLLIGSSEESYKPQVYIGESENVLKRLEQHNRDNSKEFFEYAIVITKEGQTFDKAFIQHLEQVFINKVTAANKCIIKNGNQGKERVLSEAIKADLERGFKLIAILLETLHLSILAKEVVQDDRQILYCNRTGAEAKAYYTAEGMIVIPGSKIINSEKEHLAIGISHRRESLRREGVLKSDGDMLILQEEQTFDTPSAAAAFVIGGQANGWVEWKFENGKTLDEIKRKMVKL